MTLSKSGWAQGCGVREGEGFIFPFRSASDFPVVGQMPPGIGHLAIVDGKEIGKYEVARDEGKEDVLSGCQTYRRVA